MYWSIKEAYLKAGGIGLESFEQLQSIDVRLKGKDLYEVNVADKLMQRQLLSLLVIWY